MKPLNSCWAILLLTASWYSAAFAQPALNWDITVGGESYEELNGLTVVGDGILMAGSSRSNTKYGNASDTSWNFLLVKTDFGGGMLWQKMIGGDRNDRLWALIPTIDGGFLAGGYSYSGISGQKTQSSRGGMDVWVVRLDASGQILWDKTLGGAGREELFSMVQMPDGHFVLGCHSNSDTGGEKSEMSRGELDFWLIGIDDNGTVLWDKTLGGNGEDQINDIALLPSGNILASGGTISQRNTGEVGPDFARGAKDYWILEFNPENKQVLWNRRFGGTNDDFAYSLMVTHSGNIYLGGRSASQIAPPTAINNGKNAPFRGGASDYWLLLLDAQGLKLNEWSFGGDGLDDMYFIKQNARGHICLGGVSDSGVSGNKTTPLRGSYDFWVLSMDTTGAVLWQKTVGGSDIDAPTQMAFLSNGAMLFGGHSQSDQGFEKSDNSFGVNDYWLVSSRCDLTVEINNTTPAPICSGAPAELTAMTSPCADCIFQWNTEAITAVIEVPPGTADTFVVQVMDQWGCIARDTIFVDWPMPPVIELGPSDTLIQVNETITLGEIQPGWTYVWNTGASTPSIEVQDAGFYAVTITDTAGCTSADAIQVLLDNTVSVYIPNVFAPDLDGRNDYFTVYASEGVAEVRYLQIADRWGELVYRRQYFAPNDDLLGWDGRYRGKRVEPGVFIWWAEILLTDGEKKFYKGSVTIVR